MNLSLVGISCNHLEIKIQNLCCGYWTQVCSIKWFAFSVMPERKHSFFRDPSLICNNFTNDNDNMFSLEKVVEQKNFNRSSWK